MTRPLLRRLAALEADTPNTAADPGALDRIMARLAAIGAHLPLEQFGTVTADAMRAAMAAIGYGRK
jgi:hypothetical protein